MKLLIVAFVTLCLAGCQVSHKLPPVSGKSEPVNSAEVMQMEFKLPGFKKKKDVTDSSVSFEEKNIALQERMNRIYKFGGIGGMLIGGLSLLALNAALPLKTTVVDAYLIDKVTGV